MVFERMRRMHTVSETVYVACRSFCCNHMVYMLVAHKRNRYGVLGRHYVIISARKYRCQEDCMHPCHASPCHASPAGVRLCMESSLQFEQLVLWCWCVGAGCLSIDLFGNFWVFWAVGWAYCLQRCQRVTSLIIFVPPCIVPLLLC